jgi:hypothetical protein
VAVLTAAAADGATQCQINASGRGEAGRRQHRGRPLKVINKSTCLIVYCLVFDAYQQQCQQQCRQYVTGHQFGYVLIEQSSMW